MQSQSFILITGCSGGGKSTLISALSERGYCVVEEPGRRVVREAVGQNSTALPWVDMRAFIEQALVLSREDLLNARAQDGPVFFDRGLFDAAVALHHISGVPLAETLNGRFPYCSLVFVAPPWPQIYAADAERKHGIDEAVAEYKRIIAALREWRCEIVELPQTTVSERVNFVLNTLRERQKPAS